MQVRRTETPNQRGLCYRETVDACASLGLYIPPTDSGGEFLEGLSETVLLRVRASGEDAEAGARLVARTLVAETLGSWGMEAAAKGGGSFTNPHD